MKKLNFITISLVIALVVFYFPSTLLAATAAESSSGKIKGSQVLVIGDSFLAMSKEITKRLEQNVKSAGIMDSNDRFIDNSVSGTLLNGGMSPTIPEQYKNGVKSGAIKYVIMDGGGNDCMMGSVDGAANAFKSLLKQMESDGIVKIFYLFYPDAQGSMAGTLNPNLNKLRPQIQDMVTKATKPKGYFLDLRPTFEGKYSSYILSDGIHPSTAGSNATADAIWAVMQKNNFFETTPSIVYGDYNNDGKVDSLDLAGFKQYLSDPQHTFNNVLDLNLDNTVDSIDYSIMKKYLLGIIDTLPNK